MNGMMNGNGHAVNCDNFLEFWNKSPIFREQVRQNSEYTQIAVSWNVQNDIDRLGNFCGPPEAPACHDRILPNEPCVIFAHGRRDEDGIYEDDIFHLPCFLRIGMAAAAFGKRRRRRKLRKSRKSRKARRRNRKSKSKSRRKR